VRDGKTEYDEHCVACHGEKAKGDGRMAEILTIKPANLTEISKRNGGAYPFWQVYFTIEGTVPVRGHLYMPDWGTRFKGDESKPGYPAAYLRILTLVHYLETIQEK
jgi:mono/diheme cytochrome c family protein